MLLVNIVAGLGELSLSIPSEERLSKGSDLNSVIICVLTAGKAVIFIFGEHCPRELSRAGFRDSIPMLCCS